MSETQNESNPADDDQGSEQQQIAEVDEELDAQSEGDGLAAEAGRGEEAGLTEG